jgi:hypothetical protein
VCSAPPHDDADDDDRSHGEDAEPRAAELGGDDHAGSPCRTWLPMPALDTTAVAIRLIQTGPTGTNVGDLQIILLA